MATCRCGTEALPFTKPSGLVVCNRCGMLMALQPKLKKDRP